MLETELSLVYSIQIIMKVMQENVGQNAGQKRVSSIAKHECMIGGTTSPTIPKLK